MVRKVLVGLLVLFGAVAGTIVVAPNAGAANIIHQTSRWYLAGNRACLTNVDYHDDGNVHLQTWCYGGANGQGPLEGVMDYWFPDWMDVHITAGTGDGYEYGRVRVCWDMFLGNGDAQGPDYHWRPYWNNVKDVTYGTSTFVTWSGYSNETYSAGYRWDARNANTPTGYITYFNEPEYTNWWPCTQAYIG